MNTLPFSIKESLIFGWEAFLAHYTVFVPIVFLSMAISFANDYIAKHELGSIIIYSAFLLGTIAQIVLGMGLTKIALKITAGEAIAFDDVFSATHLFFKYVGANFLYMLTVFFGFFLLIFPGFFWLVSYWLFQYILIDRETGVFASLAEAKRLSQGVRWVLFKFIMAVVGLNIAGALIFMAGLFFTIPTTVAAAAYVYRALRKRLEPERILEQTNIVMQATK